jgi:predicted N-formylglutamate amidohydrolase
MLVGSSKNVNDSFQVVNATGSSSIVLVCEHASSFIPASFDSLGLSPDLLDAHVVWDPGALGVARQLASRLDAALVAGTVSRLVYDCNRPPGAVDAMPTRSEVVDIPGNVGLTQAERDSRVKTYYTPFRTALSDQIARTNTPIIVTVHSFTPTYHGAARAVEIGVLHDTDTRLADAMMQTAERHTQADVQRNQPYGSKDGVTHTLKEHAIPGGHLNVMLEIRNDLIQTAEAQIKMADMIATWLVDACADGSVTCTG